MSTYQVIDAKDRAVLESLLNQRAASDAISTYYALEHPARKVQLYACLGSGGKPSSFLVIAQTGMDLFRTLVLPFVVSAEVLNQLMDIAIALWPVAIAGGAILAAGHYARKGFDKVVGSVKGKVFEFKRL